ncbi:MAG TPA: NrsF family protein [Vicinamibacteria bacterium]
MSDGLPPALRDEVERTLAPVRPLPAPGRRLLALLPLAAALPALVLAAWGLRGDREAVGPLLLWAGSALQVLAGLALMGAALRESVPARLRGPGALAAQGLGALGLVGALTFATFVASPTQVPLLAEARYFRICFTHTFELGLLPLLGLGLLLRRGLTARPGLAGTLAGLGAGLLADAGWRLFCHVSAPGHVFGAHLGAVLALAAASGLAGRLLRSR